MRVHITTSPSRKKPKAGDRRYLKGRGVWQVRQQQKHGGAYLVSNGRPVWEWVDEDGDRDRNRRPPQPAKEVKA